MAKPVGQILRDLTWATSLSLYDTLLMGDKWWWWKLHFHLRRAYRGWSPRRVLSELPSDDGLGEALVYGEAPASTTKKLLGLCHTHFPAANSLTDLGAGRGVLAMTAALLGWEVVAIEYLDDFVQRSKPVSLKLGCEVQWQTGNFLELPLPQSDIIHTSATAYPDDLLKKLAEKLTNECRAGQGILTQDWELPSETFEVMARESFPVSWGAAVFTLHRLKS